MGKVMKKLQKNLSGSFVTIYNNEFKNQPNNKRRSRLGINVQSFAGRKPWNYRSCSSDFFSVALSDELLGAEILERHQVFKMLRRSKLFLSLRTIKDFEKLLGLDWRREWNKSNPNRPVRTLLDLFVSLKFAHECVLPLTVRLRKRGIDSSYVCRKDSPQYRRALHNYVTKGQSSSFEVEYFVSRPDVSVSQDLFVRDYIDVVVSEKNGNLSARFDDVCRSHSIWLDPVDAPRELYKWRLRVQKAICWAYENDFVPVMMTLTIFHRWHLLKNLLRVLQKSWEKFLISGRPAARRKAEMKLEGYVRRLEITINDGRDNRLGDSGEPATNSGWHPHFHVILFVPKDKFSVLSNMEAQMKKDWVEIVCSQFKEECGEEIPASYLPAFEEHGLHLSRYRGGKFEGQLRPVKDSIYLDKIEGYDHLHVYGIDKEVSSDVVKDSKIPFDLLREITAANIDLWCEYAIATKGLPALQFSRPLIKKINAYYEAHPEKNPAPADLPPSKVVAHMETEIYRLFYRNFLIPEMRKKATEGYEVLVTWVKDKLDELGVSSLLDDPAVLPRPPDSVDDLLSKKIFAV